MQTSTFFVTWAVIVLLLPIRAGAQVFEDGLAQPVFLGAVVSEDYWVEIPDMDLDRDGINDRIRIQVNRPIETTLPDGPDLAVVLAVSPYYGGTRPWNMLPINDPLFVPEFEGCGVPNPPQDVTPPDVDPSRRTYGNETPPQPILASSYQSYFLQRGFIFAYGNLIGTGSSTGCPTIGGTEENLAVKAIVDWFNGRATAYDINNEPAVADWTTGATAMIGTSYVGTTPINGAATGVEGLKAIVPVAGVSSYYFHRRSYGMVIHSHPSKGTDANTLFDNILTRSNPEYCGWVRDRIEARYDRLTGDYNDFWDERNYVKDVSNFRAAVLISHGLNDFNVKPRHAGRFWQALKAHNVPAKIWWNQGGHGDGANSRNQAAWRDTLNRFWSHYLYDQDNGWEDEPTAVIEREDSIWVPYDDWPVPGSEAMTLNPKPSGDNTVGHLGAEDAQAAGCPDPVSVYEIIVDDSSIDAEDLAAAAQSPNRLVYKSDPLLAPVHVSGFPFVSLRIKFNEPAANVSAALVDYRANGNSEIITRGWADPQNRTSLNETCSITPGVPDTIDFALQPHDYIFPAGSRIGLVLLSSDRLFTLRPPPSAVLSVDTADSTLTLPVVGGEAAFAAAVPDRDEDGIKGRRCGQRD